MFTKQGDQEHFHPCPPRPILMDRRWKPNVELAPNCPRCDSSNTKFCYYNNYSLTQPRYFCKGCRRYWTKGGSLRNVPVGGGCRKNRRGKSVRMISTNRSSPGSSTNYGGGSLTGLGIIPRDESIESLGNVMVSSSYSNIVNPPRSDNNSSSTTTIDLALVYAKFLNQQPDCNSSVSMAAELPREFNSSFEYSPVPDPNHEIHNSIQLSQEQCMVGSSDPSSGTQLSEGKQVFLGDHQLNLNYKHQQESRIPQFTNLETSNTSTTFMLQPILPSEEIVLQDNLWLNSHMLGSWQASTQLQGFEQIVVDDQSTALHSNPLDSNWSSFDLPSYEGFPRP